MRNSCTLTLLILLPVLCFSQNFRTAKDQLKIKQLLKTQFEQTNSLQANFKEEVTSNMFQKKQQAYGRFFYRKERKVRWETTRPRKELILITENGTKLYENGKLNRNPKSNMVFKKVQKLIVGMLSGDFLNEEEFTITYMENSKMYKLELTPKSSRLKRHIASIFLYFDRREHLLQEMILNESNTQNIRYIFSEISQNKVIPTSKFIRP